MRERTGNERAVTRRDFVAGMSLGALAAAGGLAGCSQGQAAQPEPASSGASAGRINPDVVMDTDVLIIGGGMSGLACAVQAAQEGAAVLVVEKAPSLGGNGVGVEGIFGVDSPLQQEQGIEVNRSDVIQLEVSDSQYRSDGSLWVDLVDNSGGNIAWLQEQGGAVLRRGRQLLLGQVLHHALFRGGHRRGWLRSHYGIPLHSLFY